MSARTSKFTHFHLHSSLFRNKNKTEWSGKSRRRKKNDARKADLINLISTGENRSDDLIVTGGGLISSYKFFLGDLIHTEYQLIKSET